MDGAAPPTVSVVLNTYNRSALVLRVIRSVLAQTTDDLQLIVVDDGSTDDTVEVVGAVADPRLTFLRQDHAGLSPGRNLGVAHATGEWVTFLDDDDDVEPEWLAAFEDALGDDVGMVFAGHKKVSTVDGSVTECPPEPMGGVFGDVVGGWLAGTWIIRRSLFDATGGFMTDLPTLVQSEFLLRAIPACHREGLRVVTIGSTHFRYSVAPWHDRPTLTAELTIQAASSILDRHAAAFARDPASRASWNNVVGVAAARARRWPLARVHFRRAVRARPTDPRTWARLVLAGLPGRGRVWATSGRRR